jgi:UDP:flavonoid glycosyltransferase YjiC (YdhE family)
LSKILVAAPPVSGEFIPLLEIARGLAAWGHEITVLTAWALVTLLKPDYSRA